MVIWTVWLSPPAEKVTEPLVRAADFCGVRSGKDCDKWAACGLHPAAAAKICAPILEESPLSLECRVREVVELGSHHMFLADIVAIDVEDGLIDREGKLHLSGARLAAYAHGEYFSLGKPLGTFGFSVRKKPAKKRRLQ